MRYVSAQLFFAQVDSGHCPILTPPRTLALYRFVERHAWFAANPYAYGGAKPQINLVSNTLQPTPVGVAFDRTLSRLGARRVASNSE
ncbi:hypothetical protein [Celeribacter sp.]|uniref:hypothetical protein n=1 Tax=Celeribacter sp. TaxID=1890673 RepID=UPI003A90D490